MGNDQVVESPVLPAVQEAVVNFEGPVSAEGVAVVTLGGGKGPAVSYTVTFEGKAKVAGIVKWMPVGDVSLPRPVPEPDPVPDPVSDPIVSPFRRCNVVTVCIEIPIGPAGSASPNKLAVE